MIIITTNSKPRSEFWTCVNAVTQGSAAFLLLVRWIRIYPSFDTIIERLSKKESKATQRICRLITNSDNFILGLFWQTHAHALGDRCDECTADLRNCKIIIVSCDCSSTSTIVWGFLPWSTWCHRILSKIISKCCGLRWTAAQNCLTENIKYIQHSICAKLPWRHHRCPRPLTFFTRDFKGCRTTTPSIETFGIDRSPNDMIDSLLNRPNMYRRR